MAREIMIPNPHRERATEIVANLHPLALEVLREHWGEYLKSRPTYETAAGRSGRLRDDAERASRDLLELAEFLDLVVER